MTAAVSKAKWIKAHVGSDRASLRLVMLSPLIEEAERKAALLGVSMTAYVSAALVLARDHNDEIPLRIRLLERVYRMKFRRAKVPPSVQPSVPLLVGSDAS